MYKKNWSRDWSVPGGIKMRITSVVGRAVTLCVFPVAIACMPLNAADYVFRTVALSGDDAPGVNGLEFSNFGGDPKPALNDNGRVAFWGILNTVTNSRGIWKEAQELSLVVRQGDPVPGIADATFGAFGAPNLNNLGNTAFSAFLSGAPFGTEQSIWKEDPELTLVVRNGDLAPGTGGETFDEIPLQNAIAMNNQGHVAFRAEFSGPQLVPGVQNHGLWKESPALALVAKTGDVAPDTGGEIYTFLGVPFERSPELNDAGNTAFNGFISGNDLGIWKENPDIELVVREGDTPREPSGTEFSGFIKFGDLNNSGDVGFVGNLSGVNAPDQGIWKEDGADLVLVALEGDPAPGTSGAVFDNFVGPVLGAVTGPLLNDAGDAAFVAFLRGDGITSANDVGIWVKSHTDESLRLVIREGDQLEVRPGDFRTVKDLERNGGFWPEGFNNHGHLAFKAEFTDSSFGILVAVPEPSSFFLFGCAAVILARRQR